MPRTFPKRCSDCGAHVDDGAQVSRNGLCYPCGAERVAAGLAAQRAMATGDAKAMAAAVKRLRKGAGHRGVGGTSTRTKRAG